MPRFAAAAAVLLCICLFFAVPAAAGAVEVSDLNELTNAINGATGDQIIVVTQTIYAGSNVFVIGSGKNITLMPKEDSGISINRTAANKTANWGMFMIQSGGNLTLAANATDSAFTLTIDGGRQSGNTQTLVRVNGGTFTMKNGTLTNNTATSSGGGVYVDGGTFTMQGGTISGNTAKTNGGGVYVDGGTFTMSGGTISGNTVTYNFGGGVYVKDGTFAMQGGTISGNFARFGDGVYLGGGMFTMSGGSEISADNGLYPTDNTYIFIPDSGFTGSTLNITNVIAVGYPLIRVSDSLSASDYLSKFKLQSTNHGLIPDGTDKNLTVASINKLTVVNGTGTGRYCTGSPVSIAANTTTGYTFTRWTSNSGGTFADATQPTTTFTMPAKAVTVTANQRAHTYTVQYNGNGATSGETTNSEHTYDVAYPLTVNGFLKTGFTFIGWNKTGTSGTDIDYPDMASVQNLTADDRATVPLYAVWTPKTTVITLDGNGGTTAGTASVTVTYGENSVPAIISPQKTGYTFDGWNTNNDGSGTTVLDTTGALTGDGTYSDASTKKWKSDDPTLTLYAVWNQTVTLNQNGGTGGLASVTNTYNKIPETITTIPTAPQGYTFKGYAPDTTGTTTVYDSTGAIQASVTGYTNAEKKWTHPGSDTPVTLCAVWEQTVTLNTNEGTAGSETSATAKYNAAAPTLTTAGFPTRTGYTFDGYTADAAGTSVVYGTSGIAVSDIIGWTDASGNWIHTGTVTLYANWTANTTEITLDGNGHTTAGTPSAVTVTYGENSVPAITSPQKTGYTFGGWNTKDDGTGTTVLNTEGAFAGDDTYSDASTKKWKWDSPTLTLYAVWNLVPVYQLTVTNGTGGGGSHAEGATVTIIATVPSGQTFDHWETTGGVILDSSTAATTTFVMPAAAVTVTAVFKDSPVPPSPSGGNSDGNMENAFRVLFDTQGGSYVSPATDLSYGDKISKPAVPEKSGYTFGGWYKDAACTQAWAFTEVIPGDMTLYAKWTGGSAAQQTPTATAAATTQPTEKQTTAPVQTQSQGASATTAAAPAATTAAGVTPTLIQAPTPVLGALLGLLAAGVLLRRRE